MEEQASIDDDADDLPSSSNSFKRRKSQITELPSKSRKVQLPSLYKSTEGRSSPKEELPSSSKSMEGQSSPKEEFPSSSNSMEGQSLLKEELPSSSKSMEGQSSLKEELPSSSKSIEGQSSPKEELPPSSKSMEDKSSPKEELPSSSKSMEDKSPPKEEFPSSSKSMEGQSSLKDELPSSSKSIEDKSSPKKELPSSSKSMEGQSSPKEELPSSSKSIEGQSSAKEELPPSSKSIEGQSSAKEELPSSSKSIEGQSSAKEELPSSSKSMEDKSLLKEELPSSKSLKSKSSPIEESPYSSKSFGGQSSSSSDRLEDVFQDNIINAFMSMANFKAFARSRRGLCLDESDIQHIIEDNFDSILDQKMKILNKWKESKGDEATAFMIHTLVSTYKTGGDPDDYISLCKNMYGIFRMEVLSKRGHVYLGEQRSGLLGRRLRAIKLSPYDDEKLREAQILTKLGPHENIVSTIHVDIYRTDPFKYIFIVMELYSRKHLREVLEECKLKPILNERRAIDWALQIMKALVFIHQHDILHRDLKPDNVLIDDNLKHLKLTDFGISKAITDGVQTIQTNANTGTDGYRAKETYDKEAKISKKSDNYSAGITLTEICSNGKHPFGDEPHLRSSKIIKEEEPDLSLVFVKQARNLLSWMLMSDIDDRPSAAEVQTDLKRIEQDIINQSDQQSISSGMNSASTEGLMEPRMLGLSLREALKKEFDKPYFKKLNQFVKDEREHHQVYPPSNYVFAWSTFRDIERIKVVIVGDQPYSTPGLADGFSFSVEQGPPLPLSLQNIFKELERDIDGFKHPGHGNLFYWAVQGVLCLNSVLTVRDGSPDSHMNKGWERFTDEVIKLICRRNNGVVFMLWGEHAQTKEKVICTKRHCEYNTSGTILCTHYPVPPTSYCKRPHCTQFWGSDYTSYPTKPHHVLTAPSPSYRVQSSSSSQIKPPTDQANYPFIGCGHFSKANKILKKQIDWRKFSKHSWM